MCPCVPSSGEAQRALHKEVLQPQEDPGPGAAADPALRAPGSGGGPRIVSHSHVGLASFPPAVSVACSTCTPSQAWQQEWIGIG